jgi:glycolate oxidase
MAAVPKIMTGTGTVPTAIEFMDRTCVKASCEYLNEPTLCADAGAALLVTVDGTDQQQVEREYDAIGEQLQAAGAAEVFVADNPTTSERIWKVRRSLAEAFKALSPHQSLEDVVVPIAAIPEMSAGLETLARKYDCPIPCYGHAGDGNLHATPVRNPAWTLAQWHETLPKILTDIYRLAARLGGTISGEHGIGHKRRHYMELVCSKTHIDVMRAIKRALDPNNILNPGKIFDLEAPVAREAGAPPAAPPHARVRSAKPAYKSVTPGIVGELERIVGKKHVIFGDTEKLEPFSHDEIPDRRFAHMPEAVVRPRSAEEISDILKLANREMVPVTPRGAGSGLSGGAVPIHGGIVLLTDRMDSVIEIDRENMMVVVEPGVVTNHINELLKEHGLYYPGYPMSLETCFIGGNVAENAGGAKAIKYGVTSRYVTGLDLVTPTGEFLKLGGKLVKNVTGYDLIHLMVGSEGTLGVFTKITLRLLPLPRSSADLLCLFRTAQEAIAAVPKVLIDSGVTPAAIEFMDRESVVTTCRYLNETIPYEDAGALLLVSVEGPDEEVVEQEYDAIGEQVLKAGAIEVYVADSSTTSERIWRVRRSLPEAVPLISRYQSNEDIAVPTSEIPRLVAAMDEIRVKYGVQVFSYGHAGDGNIHSRIITNPSWTPEQWYETQPKMLKELYTLTARLGGVISGEHGIGHKRKDYLHLVASPGHLEMMRAVKRALDPNNILNPGKIFDL